MAEIISGKILASKIKQEVKQEIEQLGIKPFFVIVQIGDNPASNTYVRNKIKDCKECGIDSYLRYYDSLITQDRLEKFFKNMSADKGVNALMLQLPIPKHLDAQKIIDKIAPEKDVDGLTTINNGLLATGQNGFIPCTAAGCMEMIRSTGIDIAGKNIAKYDSMIAAINTAQDLTQEVNHSLTV